MADEPTVQLLLSSFCSRTLAYQRLVDGLKRSVSVFTSVCWKYLDTVVKTDRCSQYVGDIAVAAHSASELIENLDRELEQIEKVGLKLSTKNVNLVITQLNF